MAERPIRPISHRVPGVLWHVVLVVMTLVMSSPTIWAVLTSIKPTNEIYSTTPIVADPTLDHYVGVFHRWPVTQLLGDSAFMAAGVAAGQLVIAVLAAFALVYLVPRRRNVVLAVLALTLAIPPQALMIPQFLMVARFGWIDTQLGLIVPQLGGSALAVLILVQHVAAIPPSLAQAARLEGARPAEVLLGVILPLLRPAMAAVGILVFISTWNEYLWPFLVTPSSVTATVQVGLARFQTAEGIDYGGLLAAASLTSLPLLVVYLVSSRRITDAFLTSGVS